MLLQTNSYVVPRDRRAAHARLIQRFRGTMARLGCDQFDVFEQVNSNWSSRGETGDSRFVQMMRFRDRKHQQQVQAAERNDPSAQALIREFCDLINFPYQQQQSLFAVGYYLSAFMVSQARPPEGASVTPPASAGQAAALELLASDPPEATEQLEQSGDQNGDMVHPEVPETPPAAAQRFGE